jgi:hypothetical protein
MPIRDPLLLSPERHHSGKKKPDVFLRELRLRGPVGRAEAARSPLTPVCRLGYPLQAVTATGPEILPT